MSGWPVVSLGEIFDIARGGSPRPIQDFITDDPGGVNWIMIGDAPEGMKYITSTKKRIKNSGVNRSRMVYPGDFLLTNSMSFGRPYIMKTSGCIHDGWLVLSKKNGDVHPDYFYHLLGSDQLYAEFARQAAGATVKNLNIDLVKAVNVRLPPLPEQRRIAAILDKADAIRRKRQQALALADDLLRSAFLEMFGDLACEMPRQPTRPLGELVDQDRGISYGIVQRGDEDDNGVPVVRIGNFVDNEFSSEDIVRTARSISDKFRRTILKGGELLLSIRGTVGRVAIAPPEARGFNVSREVAVIPLLPGVNSVFVRAAMLTPGAQRFMVDNVKGVAQRGINLKDVRELPIPMPRPEILERFLRISEATNRIALALRTPDHLFASLSQRALRGEL